MIKRAFKISIMILLIASLLTVFSLLLYSSDYWYLAIINTVFVWAVLFLAFLYVLRVIQSKKMLEFQKNKDSNDGLKFAQQVYHNALFVEKKQAYMQMLSAYLLAGDLKGFTDCYLLKAEKNNPFSAIYCFFNQKPINVNGIRKNTAESILYLNSCLYALEKNDIPLASEHAAKLCFFENIFLKSMAYYVLSVTEKAQGNSSLSEENFKAALNLAPSEQMKDFLVHKGTVPCVSRKMRQR